MGELRNHVVVITGASSGFGRGVALKFAKAGANVVLAARRKRLLKELANECRGLGVEALAVETDVSKAAEVEYLAEQAVKKFGRIDVWVNNAGVGTVSRFEDAPLEEHEQVIRTNLLGTIYGAYAALQQFRARGKGVLINVGSFAGKVAAPYLSSYSASKFGVRGLGMSLRQELENNGEDCIHVSTVMPVSMDTPFFEHAANHTGKPVKPIPPVYDPQKVVDVIYQMALEPQDEVVVGSSGRLGSIAQRLAPSLMEKQMGKQTHKSQMAQDESAPDNSGSVLHPMNEGSNVYGGWDSNNKSKLAKTLGIAIPAGVGLLYYAVRHARARRAEASRAA